MMRRVFGAMVLAVGAFATQGIAQDAVTLKFAEPKAGDRVKVTETENAVTTTSFTVQGMAQKKVEKATKTLVYVEEILTAPVAAGKKPLKLKRTYEKAEIAKDGQAQDTVVTGKTVLIEKSSDKYTFMVSGEKLTGPIAAGLEKSFNGPDSAGPQAFMPDKPVKPGDTWKVDTKKALADFPKDAFEIDEEKSTISGKLVKTYKKGNAGYGAFEINTLLPITGLGPKAPLKVKDGSTLTMTISGDGCIDGTSQNGDTATKTIIKIEGSTQGIDVTVVTEISGTKKQEELKK